jgi:DnaJ-class molecular chaperone
MGPEVDLDDILAQMFGSGMGGGMGGMGGMPGMGRQPRKGRDVEQEYEVTLEELYKGKTTRFSNTKNIVCQTCKGSGGKEKAKPHQCAVCGGNGMFILESTPDRQYKKSNILLTIYFAYRRYHTTSPRRPRARHTGNSPLLYLFWHWVTVQG